MPSTQETQLRIRQTLDVDPEINFINWELNIQDVAAATARSVHARGLLSLVLNPTQPMGHTRVQCQHRRPRTKRDSATLLSPRIHGNHGGNVANGNHRIPNEKQNSGRLDERRTKPKT